MSDSDDNTVTPTVTQSTVSATHHTQSILLASTLSGLTAGAVGVFVGFPFDTLKTRIQASASGTVTPVPHTLKGLKSLYRGVLMPLTSTGVMQACNFAIYGAMKFHLQPYVHEGSLSYLQSVFVSGAVAGGVMSVLATPIQVVKVQYQTDSSMTLHKLISRLCGGTKLPIVALYREYFKCEYNAIPLLLHDVLDIPPLFPCKYPCFYVRLRLFFSFFCEYPCF